MKDPKPFIRWVGGKRQILHTLVRYSPKDFDPQKNRYFEPFIGSGALFFALKPSKAIISDSNPELINAYCVIRDDVVGLLRHLQEHKAANSEKHYYMVRGLDPDSLTAIENAARFLYLNKTCFNGLYRVNKAGKFNVPFNHFKSACNFDEDNLRSVSAYLNNPDILILCRDYLKIQGEVHPGDFVYLDPPCRTFQRKTQVSAAFTQSDFGGRHLELAEVFQNLQNQGAYVMVSSSNTPFITRLYDKESRYLFMLNTARRVSCLANNRGRALYAVLALGGYHPMVGRFNPATHQNVLPFPRNP